MTTLDRFLHSKEHAVIALRGNSILAATLIGLAVLTIQILPSIIA